MNQAEMSFKAMIKVMSSELAFFRFAVCFLNEGN
jgi:hypothetical protein